MNTVNCLFELGTEELPPTSLKTLADALTSGVVAQLNAAGIETQSVTTYAAPRRLAFLLENLPEKQPDREIERRGPAVQAAFKDGQPTKAAEGFARSCGTTVDQLSRLSTDKGEWLAYTLQEQGKHLSELLPEMINKSLDQLPIPKRMRWGNRKAQFVRPTQWAVLMLDDRVIDADIIAQKTGRQSLGHRFHHPEAVSFKQATDYAAALETAYVLADFERRKLMIKAQIEAEAQKLGGTATIDEDLLEEVTALVEWPVAMTGQFEEVFLDVPQEALIYTMESNQKYFTVLDKDGKLLPNFITISNIDSKNPQAVIQGNERVVRPRLSDAKFFFETDQKKTLAEHGEMLKSMVFQNELGTLADKTERLSLIAGKIAAAIGADQALAQEAGALAKSDLVTDMVYEFTDLQGIMGYYYASKEGKPAELALALKEQYLPRFSGDELPSTAVGLALSLADKIDTLVGIIGIGQFPTGDKDPFALRRATLGILRILIEKQLPLDLAELVKISMASFADKLSNDTVLADVLRFVEGRYRAWYQEKGIGAQAVAAVQATQETRPVAFDARVQAVAQFSDMPEAEALAAANKRVSNILAKSDQAVSELKVDESLFELEQETQLWQQIQEKQAAQSPLLADQAYGQALVLLADLRERVDLFFDHVIVMADDAAIRDNRLALLAALQQLFMNVADISKLD